VIVLRFQLPATFVRFSAATKFLFLRCPDESVIVLAKNCLHLRVLGLYGCERITDVAMYSLVNHKNCRTSAMRSNKRSANSANSTGDVWWSQYYSRARKCKSVSSAMAYSSVQRSCGNSGDASNPTFLKGCFDSLFPGDPAGYGLMSLNLSGCKALSAQAVQAVCNAFPELHTCPERYSLNMSGCLNLTSVHCVCGDEARRERLHQADYAARQPAIPRPPRLSH
jgi:F-box and leucine-rich repeat protein 1 (S-phase kinase-associated protein 2)